MISIEPRPDGAFLPGIHPGHPTLEQPELAPLARALRLGDERPGVEAGGLFLPAALLREWSDDVLKELGLQLFPGPMLVDEVGVAGNPRYTFRVTWDGRPGVVEGCWLALGAERYLVPADQQAAWELLGASQGRDKVTVFKAIADLQRQAAARPDRIQLVRRLARRKIARAEDLRIRRTSDSGVEPVFSGPDGEIELDPTVRERVEAEALWGDAVVTVGDDQYVVASQGAAKGALLTELVRSATPDEQARFLQNPTTFLPEGTPFDEADYSERVLGVGLAPPRAADGPKGEREWAPDVGGLILDTPAGRVVIAADDLDPFRAAVAEAVEAGAPSVAWDGHPVPVSPQMLAEVDRALREQREPDEKRERGAPNILLIRENDVALSWAPEAGGGRAVADRSLPALKSKLQEHQVASLTRLQTLWCSGSPGALLCDDMGLGKTLQAMVFGAWVARELRRAPDPDAPVDIPVCVVAPPTLLQSWAAELARHLPDDLFARVLWGQSESIDFPGERRFKALKLFLKEPKEADKRAPVLEGVGLDVEGVRGYRPDILMIAYDTLRRLQFAVGKLQIGVLIADEVHEAKDPSSLRSRALRAMKYNFGLALTGTPIQNSWRDLWTVCDFAVPGRLGTLVQFRSEYPDEGDIPGVGARLAARVDHVMIRRTRGDVLASLPPCEIVQVVRPMPEAQARAYAVELARRSRGPILSLIRDLAMVCLHPRIRVTLQTEAEARAWFLESARTAVLLEVLDQARVEGSCVLVFVDSRAMQETLQRAIQLAVAAPYVAVLNGDVPQRNRQQILREVEAAAGFRVLLLGPKVGGAGLNLQFATRSVHLERPWNPATEAQMIARIHRMGQTRPVSVYLPVAAHPAIPATFDQVLDGLLGTKEALATSVLAPAEREDDVVSGLKDKLGFGTGDEALFEPRLPVEWVDRPADVERVCADLAAEPFLALDVETTLSADHSLCLIQLATPERVVLIDALPAGNVEPLRRLLEDERIVKVIHNASFERGRFEARGMRIHNVFDTLVASRERHGKAGDGGHTLAAVCERELGLSLDKREQKGDWRHRPLTEAQRRYAAADVEVLVRLYRELRGGG